jgi:hypothetical protein
MAPRPLRRALDRTKAPQPTPIPGIEEPDFPPTTFGERPPTPTPQPMPMSRTQGTENTISRSQPPAAASDQGASAVDANVSPVAPPLPTQLPDGNGGAIMVPPPQISPFSADSNLINSQINPTAGPRTMELQGLQDAALRRTLTGPDRNAMARDQYSTWEAETAPGFEHSLTDATNAAAAHGQLRSGMLTNRYGDLARQRLLDQTTARNRYMQQALEGSIGDTQRGFENVSGAAGRAFNEDLSGREELRGERGYQRSQAEQALLNRIRQQQAESQAESQDFGQGAELYGMGNAGDPTGAYESAAAGAGAAASDESAQMAALIRALIARQGRERAA